MSKDRLGLAPPCPIQSTPASVRETKTKTKMTTTTTIATKPTILTALRAGGDVTVPKERKKERKKEREDESVDKV